MKKILTLTLLLVFLCALTLTFTACSFFATADPIVGNYCGQVDFDTSNYNTLKYAHWEIVEKDGELVVSNYYLFEEIVNYRGEHSLDFNKLVNSGQASTDSKASFLTLTKTDTGYTATAKCGMLDIDTLKPSPSTYTLTLDNGTLTIVCKDDATSESKTYTLTSTTKTFLEYHEEIEDTFVK